LEIAGSEQLCFTLLLLALVPQRSGLRAIFLLALIAYVSFAIAVVGNVAFDAAGF
jgi:hypothetical protein